jgi:predicted TIM-barrel fold metal-dependent hydrolase
MRGAIDIHVHPRTAEFVEAMGERAQQMAVYFGRPLSVVSYAELAERYRQRGMRAVLLNATHEQSTGQGQPVPNERFAADLAAYPDVFRGFGGVDPWLGEAAVREIRRCKELGLLGLKFNPGRQGFYPNDRRFYPLWEEAAHLGLVVLFHSGMMGAGAGRPGGMGYHLRYTEPIPYLDDVAADFPTLTIIGAHPAWPWEEEGLAVARHKGNYYIDLSGWAPRYFSPPLVQAVATYLQDKTLFGSDWPVIDLDRWLREFDQLPIPDPVKEKILRTNAERLLGWQGQG